MRFSECGNYAFFWNWAYEYSSIQWKWLSLFFFCCCTICRLCKNFDFFCSLFILWFFCFTIIWFGCKWYLTFKQSISSSIYQMTQFMCSEKDISSVKLSRVHEYWQPDFPLRNFRHGTFCTIIFWSICVNPFMPWLPEEMDKVNEAEMKLFIYIYRWVSLFWTKDMRTIHLVLECSYIEILSIYIGIGMCVCVCVMWKRKNAIISYYNSKAQ